MAIKYRIVLDCEACPLDKDFEGVSPYNMFAYDLGWCVTDRNGNVYRTRSFVIKEIFEEKELMQSAFYAKKIPQYIEEIASGERVLASFYEVRQAFCEDVAEFNVKEVFAHNMRFDYGTLNNTQRWLTKSKYRYFFPYDVEICDTLKMARQLLSKSRVYKSYCNDYGYTCKNGTPRFTAEILYRFITGDENFNEEHTGLADVLIEKEIMAYLFSKHKIVDYHLWANRG